MITSDQIRAARALLRWSAKTLSEESGVSLPTIQRMEVASGVPKGLSRNLDAIQRTLERAGILFIDEDGGLFIDEDGGGFGVRLRDRRGR